MGANVVIAVNLNGDIVGKHTNEIESNINEGTLLERV